MRSHSKLGQSSISPIFITNGKYFGRPSVRFWNGLDQLLPFDIFKKSKEQFFPDDAYYKMFYNFFLSIDLFILTSGDYSLWVENLNFSSISMIWYHTKHSKMFVPFKAEADWFFIFSIASIEDGLLILSRSIFLFASGISPKGQLVLFLALYDGTYFEVYVVRGMQNEVEKVKLWENIERFIVSEIMHWIITLKKK